MPADRRVEVKTGAIVTVGRAASDTPERRSLEMCNGRAVELDLMKFRSQIVISEIRIDAVYHERPAQRPVLFAAQIFEPAFEPLMNRIECHSDIKRSPVPGVARYGRGCRQFPIG